MMMLPAGWVTDLVPQRSVALRMLGNGVVPPQAAHAIAGLLARLEVDLGPPRPVEDISSTLLTPPRQHGLLST